ncbi:hypothetical protein MLD38_036188 [Melastoma candidum]|uniref:Uncharacterized protein n=1 Tax=Melastoma candidum TaxID=119954 RepID=A0ACB9LJM2_9MYRT|nr:hypothetical protein MLD38_036188 [Melastoma candidum]
MEAILFATLMSISNEGSIFGGLIVCCCLFRSSVSSPKDEPNTANMKEGDDIEMKTQHELDSFSYHFSPKTASTHELARPSPFTFPMLLGYRSERQPEQ